MQRHPISEVSQWRTGRSSQSLPTRRQPGDGVTWMRTVSEPRLSSLPEFHLLHSMQPILLAVVVDLDDRSMAVIAFTPIGSFFLARGLLALVMAEAISPFYCPHYDVRCDAEDAKDNQDVTYS